MENRYKYTDEKKEHLHTLDGKPLIGTSSVIDVVSKPLTWWASGLAVGWMGWKNVKTVPMEECLESANEALEKIKEMDESEYYDLLCDAYKAHSKLLKDSAGAGTDLHAELERYVKHVITTGDMTGPIDMDKKILPFVEWAQANVKRFLWSEMYCYSEVHWLGGISDCGAELKDGSYVLIDFKSSKEAYPSQFLQIGGYDLEISENGGFTAKGEKVFTLDKPISQHIIFPFGAKDPKPVVRYNTAEAKKAFVDALNLRKYLESIK